MGVKATIVNVVCISKKQECGGGSRPRLVKVIVVSEHEKALLLCNCTKLHDKNNSEEVRRIYKTPDLTSKEQQQNKALRSRLAEMNYTSRATIYTAMIEHNYTAGGVLLYVHESLHMKCW